MSGAGQGMVFMEQRTCEMRAWSQFHPRLRIKAAWPAGGSLTPMCREEQLTRRLHSTQHLRDADAMRTCRPYLLVCDAVEICSSFRHEQTWFHKEAILIVQRKIAGFFRQENNYKKLTALYPITV